MSTSDVRFAHGVASGDPYTDSVILWTRVTAAAASADPIEVRWEIATSADFAPGSIQGSGSFSTSAARDWTVKVEAAGLSADTAYYYRFSSAGTVSSIGQTKTLPVNSDPVRLAVFSCANFPAAQQFDAYARAAAINSANPYDAWLQVGDYIYEYGPGGYSAAEAAAGSRSFLPNREIISLDDYRQRYAQYHSDSGLQALRAAAPLIAIWDDHETANDSWKDGAENHQSATEGDWIARRDAALKAYYEWIPIREPGQRQPSDGATAASPLTQGYRSFRFGDVLALYMLETRLTARDQQLQYPDAAAVQARIGAILADPAQVASYASKAGIAPPAGTAAIPAFANALAPLVTQELVLATVQQAWGDPNRDLIGDSQLAWLQQQLATSTAAWQVLGQQVLMQSMAVPAELLLNAGDPALLDKYAAPLQKLATGTPFASLSAAEQALFAESTKIPYNLDAWDGYGVERETILQTALALGKRLISLAGDTHNAWAGVLDTMSAGSKPAGTVAGVEFATPGVTSPGLEKYLPGADAYIRAKYPAVDGLDGLFLGYVNGLRYADLNRRGFLDLTVSKEQALGSFQLLNGIDAASGKALWSSQTVVSSSSYALATAAEARPLISWQPGWRELDLSFGLAFDGTGAPTLLDPAAYASVPRDGVRLADVRVQGSPGADTVVVGAGATVESGAGSDQLDNSDSRGGNVLAGGAGTDQFLLRAADDVVIGGSLQANALALGLPAVVGLADGERDTFLIDSSNPAASARLQILDYEPGIDQILLDGIAPQTPWTQLKSQLQSLNIDVNAAPSFLDQSILLNPSSGQEIRLDLSAKLSDPDNDALNLVLLEGPAWIRTQGTTVISTLPAATTLEQLLNTRVVLGLSDGRALVKQEIGINAYIAGPTTIAGVNLGSTPLGYALKNATAAPLQITYPGGNASASNPGANWEAIAAAATSSGYQLYWRNSVSTKFARWDLNSSGAYTAGSFLSEAQLISEEKGINFDLNGDGTIGDAYTAGPTTIAGVNLGSTPLGYALKNATAAPLQITYPGGNASAANPGANWEAIAAAATSSGYQLYWRNSVSSQFARWDLNSSGAYTAGSFLSNAALYAAEQTINFDLNKDTVTGLPLTSVIFSKGDLTLGTSPQGYALRQGSAAAVPITFAGQNASPTNPGFNWIAVAAAASATGFDLYWRNTASLDVGLWQLSSSGVLATAALISGPQLLAAETSLGFDLNANGFIAAATPPGIG